MPRRRKQFDSRLTQILAQPVPPCTTFDPRCPVHPSGWPIRRTRSETTTEGQAAIDQGPSQPRPGLAVVLTRMGGSTQADLAISAVKGCLQPAVDRRGSLSPADVGHLPGSLPVATHRYAKAPLNWPLTRLRLPITPQPFRRMLDLLRTVCGLHADRYRARKPKSTRRRTGLSSLPPVVFPQARRSLFRASIQHDVFFASEQVDECIVDIWSCRVVEWDVPGDSEHFTELVVVAAHAGFLRKLFLGRTAMSRAAMRAACRLPFLTRIVAVDVELG